MNDYCTCMLFDNEPACSLFQEKVDFHSSVSEANLISAADSDNTIDSSRSTLKISPNDNISREALPLDNSEIISNISHKKRAFENDIEVFKMLQNNKISKSTLLNCSNRARRNFNLSTSDNMLDSMIADNLDLLHFPSMI